MFRTSTMMGSSFSGTHVSTGVLGSANGTIMGGIGLHQALNSGTATPALAGVPGSVGGAMMSGLLVHPALNGSGGSLAFNMGPALGSGTATGIAGLHQTMIDVMQDALSGYANNSATGNGLPQSMLDFMTDIHLVGLAHTGLGFSSLG